MSHNRKAFTEGEREEIARELKKRNKATDERRLLILQAAEDGRLTTEMLAETFHVSKSSVSHIITVFRKEGTAGIRSTKVGGNRRNLSIEEEKELLERYVQQGQQGRIIEASEIWRAYEAKMGRKVSSCAVYGLLKRNGWRKVMPRSKHPKKASPEAIESFKKNHRAGERAYGNISFSFSSDVSGRSRLWTDQ